MAHHDNHDRTYVVLWAVLLVALGVSLLLGQWASSTTVVALIFGIAAVKAVLVVGWYMHLAVEPAHLKLVMVGATAAVLCFFGGVYPDVGRAWSVVEQPAAAEHVLNQSKGHANPCSPKTPMPGLTGVEPVRLQPAAKRR